METTDQAETDLREIYEYIAFELLAPDYASGQLDRLEAHIERLGEFPEKFRRYEKEPWNGRGMRVINRIEQRTQRCMEFVKVPYAFFGIKKW